MAWSKGDSIKHYRALVGSLFRKSVIPSKSLTSLSCHSIQRGKTDSAEATEQMLTPGIVIWILGGLALLYMLIFLVLTMLSEGGTSKRVEKRPPPPG